MLQHEKITHTCSSSNDTLALSFRCNEAPYRLLLASSGPLPSPIVRSIKSMSSAGPAAELGADAVQPSFASLELSDLTSAGPVRRLALNCTKPVPFTGLASGGYTAAVDESCSHHYRFQILCRLAASRPVARPIKLYPQLETSRHHVHRNTMRLQGGEYNVFRSSICD